MSECPISVGDATDAIATSAREGPLLEDTRRSSVRLALDGDRVRLDAVILPSHLTGYRHAALDARYEKGRRLASPDRLPEILRGLREAGIDAEPEAQILELLRQDKILWLDARSAEDRLDLRSADDKTLRAYQRTGARWLARRTGALLADQQRLGKTLCAIAALPAGAPAIVVCPASVKDWWAEEIERWRPMFRPRVLSGRGSFRWPEPAEILITNYDVLPEALPWKAPPGVVLVGDEIHRVKDAASERSTRFRRIAEAVRSRGGRTWGLTGTPMQNGPLELWHVLEALGIAEEAFGDKERFVRLFRGREIEHGYRWGLPDGEVVDAFQKVALRRMLVDVYPELPPVEHETRHVEVDRRTLRACDAYVGRFGGVEKLARDLREKKVRFEDVERVRTSLATAKIPALLELVDELREDGPLLVFSMHRRPLDALARRRGWEAIHGDVPVKDRQAIVDRFQAGKLRGLALAIRSAGEGLRLSRASRAIFVDESWNPKENEQAEMRFVDVEEATRGKIATFLRARHPLDERLVELCVGKRRIIAASVDAAASRNEPASDLAERARILREEHANAPRTFCEAVASDLETLRFRDRKDAALALDLAEEARIVGGLPSAAWEIARTLLDRAAALSPASDDQESAAEPAERSGSLNVSRGHEMKKSKAEGQEYLARLVDPTKRVYAEAWFAHVWRGEALPILPEGWSVEEGEKVRRKVMGSQGLSKEPSRDHEDEVEVCEGEVRLDDVLVREAKEILGGSSPSDRLYLFDRVDPDHVPPPAEIVRLAERLSGMSGRDRFGFLERMLDSFCVDCGELSGECACDESDEGDENDEDEGDDDGDDDEEEDDDDDHE
jgi:superfamily II DNA or RNA helicase